MEKVFQSEQIESVKSIRFHSFPNINITSLFNLIDINIRYSRVTKQIFHFMQMLFLVMVDSNYKDNDGEQRLLYT